jgi:hypothetical protein
MKPSNTIKQKPDHQHHPNKKVQLNQPHLLDWFHDIISVPTLVMIWKVLCYLCLVMLDVGWVQLVVGVSFA